MKKWPNYNNKNKTTRWSWASVKINALSAYNASGSSTDEYKCAPITGQRSDTKLSKMSLQWLPCTDTSKTLIRGSAAATAATFAAHGHDDD